MLSDTPTIPTTARYLPGRLMGTPLRYHVGLLALVLAALTPIIGLHGSFSADEGATLAEVHAVVAHHSWLVAHPLPAADPSGHAYPFELSDWGTRGTAPFAKHPLYVTALVAADRVAGAAGVVGLGLLGTVLAALGAALLGRRLDSRLAVPSLWTVGLVSPLLFDGYLVIAHSLAAAAAVGAVLWTLRALERRRLHAAAVAAAMVFLATLLRNEALLFAGALAVAAAAAVRRSGDRRAWVLPMAILGGGLAAHRLDPKLTARVVGAGVPSFIPPSATGGGHGILQSVHGFAITWLDPGLVGGLRATAVAAAAVLLVLAGVTARLRPGEKGSLVAPAAMAAVAAAIALVAPGGSAAPGILAAFPLLGVGLFVLRRGDIASQTARLAVVTGAVFAAAVIATQYANGGSGEWGGRYFAIGLPVVVPVLLAAIRRQVGTLDSSDARALVGALVIVSMALTGVAVKTLRAAHRGNADLVSFATTAASAAGPMAPGQEPLVVATNGAVPRFAWQTTDAARWLLVQSPDLGAYGARFEAVGVRRFVLLTERASGAAAVTPEYRVVERLGRSGSSLHGYVMERR